MKKEGSNLSFAIANGNLDEANTPEFAIEIKVKTPITAIVTANHSPDNEEAKVWIGL